MSLIIYATKLMNLYCGFQLTWKTCEAFKKSNENSGDTLLIKWFLLYSFIQFEGMLFLILELLPFGFIVPFLFKGYIMMPHSKWHSLIYSSFEKLEMDEYTSNFFIYLSKGVKFATIKVLSILETYIDIVRVEDLPEVDAKVQSIMDKILTKKYSVEVKQSKIRSRKSEPRQEAKQSDLIVQASVLEGKKYVDYTIAFNCTTSQVQFINPLTNQCVHTKTLLLIDLNEDKCLKASYSENDGNLSLIKLKRSEDIALWLTPVIDILIQRAQLQ